MKKYLIATILVVFIIIPSIYFFLGDTIWLDFLPNFLATFLGAVIGIPIAIGINNYIDQISQKRHKEKITPLLNEELLVNMSHLSSWQKSQTSKIEIVYKGIFLETGLWDVLSENGELTCIREPKILSQLSYTYSLLRILKELTERYMDLVHLSDEKERELLQSLVAQLIGKGIDSAIEEITKTSRVL
jgi:hypothetical protein